MARGGSAFSACVFVTGLALGIAAPAAMGGDFQQQHAAAPAPATPAGPPSKRFGFCFGFCGELPPCEIDYATKNVCGRRITYAKFCDDTGPPRITGAMTAEAGAYPELADGDEGSFGCVTVSGGEDCEANEGGDGDGLAAKVGRLRAGHTKEKKKDEKPAADGGDERREKEGEQAAEQFHVLVTEEAFEDSRDDAAIVAHRGFSREISVFHLQYLLPPDKNFHESAEGVDLATRAAVDKEREEQRKLADALGEMKEKFEGRKDGTSAKNTGYYQEIALGRAELLDGISCELRRMSDINRDRQNRMGPITDAAVKGEGDGQGDDIHLGNSSITGTGETPILPDPAGSARVSAPPSAARQDEILSSYSGYASVEHAPPVAADPELDLFSRLHRKYQEKERAGFFYRTIVD